MTDSPRLALGQRVRVLRSANGDTVGALGVVVDSFRVTHGGVLDERVYRVRLDGSTPAAYVEVDGTADKFEPVA